MPLAKTKRQQLEVEVQALVPEALKWKEDKVAQFITDLGFPQYKLCFTDNFITGRKLIYLDMATLPKIGITDYEHMKKICQAIKDLMGVMAPRYDRSISLPRRDSMDLFLEVKGRTGEKIDALTFPQFLQKYSNQLRT